jgi:hypothetical protein
LSNNFAGVKQTLDGKPDIVHAVTMRVKYAVDLGGHDEVILMQSIDLLGVQRDRCMAPTEANIPLDMKKGAASCGVPKGTFARG